MNICMVSTILWYLMFWLLNSHSFWIAMKIQPKAMSTCVIESIFYGTFTIDEDIINFVTKQKFCDNPKNKAQLVPLIAKHVKERLPEINVMQCCDDADTEIVKGALDASRYGQVEKCILITYLLLQRIIAVFDCFIHNYFIFRFLLMRV